MIEDTVMKGIIIIQWAHTGFMSEVMIGQTGTFEIQTLGITLDTGHMSRALLNNQSATVHNNTANDQEVNTTCACIE